MSEPVLDRVLATLSYEVIEMLRMFQEARSFKEVGLRFGRDERTVSTRLLEVNKAFLSTQHAKIIDRTEGQKKYFLTPTGKEFVRALEPITAATLGAIEAAAAATKRVPVVCTSNCLSYFQRLTEALPPNRTFDIIPLARRTAEIDLNKPEEELGSRVCLASALMSSAQSPSKGVVTQWNDRIEVLPLEIDFPSLLSVEDIGIRRTSITVRDAVEAGVTFLTPDGGVAWDFLNRSYPEWRLRPFQHNPVPDLDWGLKCLAGRLIPRSAMVVHGLSDAVYERYGLNHVRKYEFSNNGSHRLVAVTGLFHLRHEASPSQPMDPFELVWEAAQSLWSERVRTL